MINVPVQLTPKENMECGLSVGYDICRMQTLIFDLAADMGFDDDDFIEKYMNSDFCNLEMDALYSFFQMADPKYCMSYILDEITPKKNTMHYDWGAIEWTGWMYRYLQLRFRTPSKKIYGLLPLKTMLGYYPGMRTQDAEYFADVLREKWAETDITLYYGSRTGNIKGIRLENRLHCDFGKGFYMYADSEYAKTLVCNAEDPIIYTAVLKIQNIPDERILALSEMDWVYYVLYNRGLLESMKGTEMYERAASLDENKDLIVGPTATDAINTLLQKFTDSRITDKALLECIQDIGWRKQYVAKTEYACSQIEILSEEKPDMQNYSAYGNSQRRDGESAARDILKRYRRKGRYFDEIIAEETGLDMPQHCRDGKYLDEIIAEYEAQNKPVS